MRLLAGCFLVLAVAGCDAGPVSPAALAPACAPPPAPSGPTVLETCERLCDAREAKREAERERDRLRLLRDELEVEVGMLKNETEIRSRGSVP